MADLSPLTAPVPAASPVPLQRALVESARQFSAEAAQFAQEWHGHWPHAALAGDLDTCVEAMCMLLDRLAVELSQAGRPAETEVARLIGALLGTTTAPGPLRVLQALTRADTTSPSLEEQRLLSQVEVLRIQLNALRAQWQDYLSVVALSGDVLTPRQRTDAVVVVPVRRRARWGQSLWRGLRETFTTFATLGAVLVVIIGIAYLVVTHAPPDPQPPATTLAGQTANVPPATQVSGPTSVPPLPTSPPLVPPPATPAPQPTSAPVSSGPAQLTINPAVLLVPCPGAGAGTLQLVNTSAQPVNWQARAHGFAGANPGVALDVAQGSLEAGGVAFINVTALAQDAQGTITISSSGAASAATVTYSVSC